MKFNIINPFKNIFKTKKTEIIEKSKVNNNYYENNIKWNDTVEFKFPIKGGKVIKVYDGDTITIASKLPYDESPLYRFSVRLKDIDTPEIKGKNISDDEKTAAILARDFVSNLIIDKFVRLENIENEKYGRILADVYYDDININSLLLDRRYAVKYDGKTKIKPISWLKYKQTGYML